MEEAIKRVLEADHKAQEALEQLSSLDAEHDEQFQLLKSEIESSAWESAKAFVHNSKIELDDGLSKSREENDLSFKESIDAVEKRYKENEDYWRKLLVERCISNTVDD